MRFSFSHLACLVAATSLVDAKEWHKTMRTGPPGNPLLVRQSDDDGNCSAGNTCADCYGAGNIVCSSDSCFNPSAGEQCCSDGEYCIGSDTSCCGAAGPGVTGGAEDDEPTSTSTVHVTTTSTTSLTSSATATSGDDGDWDCLDADSGEQCCQRGGKEWHWCYGSDPMTYCYRPTLGEVCCSDQSICDSGADCCSASDAVATTPSPDDSIPSTTASASRSSSRAGYSSTTGHSSTAASTSKSSATSSTRSTASNTGSASATTTGPLQVTANAAPARAECMLAALGVVGAGLALL